VREHPSLLVIVVVVIPYGGASFNALRQSDIAVACANQSFAFQFGSVSLKDAVGHLDIILKLP
jgi:hypothetical protein